MGLAGRMGVQELRSPRSVGAKPSPEPPAGAWLQWVRRYRAASPRAGWAEGVSKQYQQRENTFLSAPQGRVTKRNKEAGGKRREKGRSCSPKAAPPPGRSAGSRPLRGLPPSSTERRLGVQTVPVVSCTQPAGEHTQQPRAHLSRVVRGRPDGAAKRSGAFRHARTLARRGATRACRSACPRAGWFFPRERQRGERAGGRLFIWPVW